ncbi:Protein maelstrom homolog [Eumeta japonica]|uniref:Protein maelstrom homolog n=1 Tax=Eumeta variegata TaxID=151549 RepID=A0A4C1WJQ8_EUMVA|nr:Protein maelstrom homolog [Eumeta japonica]
MPKKPTRNGFYYYMQTFKEQQRKNGIVYNNLKETADAAGPYWTELPKSEKDRYNALAKQGDKNNEGNHRYTSMGVSFAEIDRREREKREAEERETQDIRNIVVSKAFAQSLIQEDFFVMDVNHYCCTSHGEYVICECTLLTFNFMDGIKDVYHEIINPGRQWQMLSMVRTRSPLVRLIALSAHAEVAAGHAVP